MQSHNSVVITVFFGIWAEFIGPSSQERSLSLSYFLLGMCCGSTLFCCYISVHKSSRFIVFNFNYSSVHVLTLQSILTVTSFISRHSGPTDFTVKKVWNTFLVTTTWMIFLVEVSMVFLKNLFFQNYSVASIPVSRGAKRKLHDNGWVTINTSAKAPDDIILLCAQQVLVSRVNLVL